MVLYETLSGEHSQSPERCSLKNSQNHFNAKIEESFSIKHAKSQKLKSKKMPVDKIPDIVGLSTEKSTHFNTLHSVTIHRILLILGYSHD